MKRYGWWLVSALSLVVAYLSQHLQVGIRKPELIPTGYLVRSEKFYNSVRVYRSYPDGSLAPLYDPISTNVQANWTIVELVLSRELRGGKFRSIHIVTRSFRLRDGMWTGSRDDSGVSLPIEVHATFDP